MEWTDQALVLRMGAFRESDLWLKLLCREHGLLTLFAFGGSRQQATLLRLSGCAEQPAVPCPFLKGRAFPQS